MVRDLCTCGDEECYALESANMYLMTGDTVAAAPACKVNELDMCYDPAVIDGHNYLYFYYDFSDESAPFDAEGRINAARLDLTGIDVNTPGKNAFDLCFGAFFRNTDEAIAFAEEYLKSLGWTEETEPETTEAVTEGVVEVETNDKATEGKTDDNATEDKGTEAVSEAASEEASEEKQTEKATEEKDIEDGEKQTEGAGSDEEPAGGCGSTVGFGAIAIIALAGACGFVTLKKKD